MRKNRARTKINKAFILELKAYGKGKTFAQICKHFYPVAPSTLWYYMTKHDVAWKKKEGCRQPDKRKPGIFSYHNNPPF